MEATSSYDSVSFDINSIYEEILPEIENGLRHVEKDPEFKLGITRTKTIEIALRVLKNGEAHTYYKTLHQHQWSWSKFACCFLGAPLIPILYQQYHYYRSTYSKEKTLNLIQEAFKDLLINSDVSSRDLLNCVVTVNTANQSFFSRGYWFCFKDSSQKFAPISF